MKKELNWRDTSRWNMPIFEAVEGERGEFAVAFGLPGKTAKENIKYQETRYAVDRRKNYKPPTATSFFTVANIDEISNVLLAAKEKKAEWQDIKTVVYANLPLPPEDEHGSGMVGDVYCGNIESNVVSILGYYLDGELQSYNPVEKRFVFHPKKTLSEMPKIKKEVWGYEIGHRGGFETARQAVEWWKANNDGSRIMMSAAPEPGSNYYKDFPETYEKLIGAFRADPAKLLGDTIRIIEAQLQEDRAGLKDFLSFYGKDGTATPDGIARRKTEKVTGRRARFRDIKGELEGGY